MYFYVFAGAFELYGAARFINSLILLHISPHYSKYRCVEGRCKEPDASSWVLGHVMAIGFLYVSLNGITKGLRHSVTKLNIVVTNKKY